jgi:hypothetical protein
LRHPTDFRAIVKDLDDRRGYNRCFFGAAHLQMSEVCDDSVVGLTELLDAKDGIFLDIFPCGRVANMRDADAHDILLSGR